MIVQIQNPLYQTKTLMPYKSLPKEMEELLMLQQHQKENAKKDSGFMLNKWHGKWINSQESSTLKTTKTLYLLLNN
jgi:hypothetical protein